MDDLLEAPSSLLPNTSVGDPAPEDELQSDEEEGGLDWTKLLPPSARPMIPKRGEKEYEPRAAGGTNLQIHILERSRNAMFETLRTNRSISSKAISYAIWHPRLARTEITVARGIHFANMGHSAPRSVVGDDGAMKTYKRLELLPEEAIYLIERGALFCWKESDLALGHVPGLDDVLGSPMSVQQAYSEMTGTEDTTLEHFQVFSYLKRLGYVVTRANPPDPYYPVPSKLSITNPCRSFAERLWSIFSSWISTFFRPHFGFSWWKPLRISCCLHHDKNYGSIFRSLRFIPNGHSVQLKSPDTTTTTPSPYKIFYNVYKPSTLFKKSSPPPPDFQLVVVNARTTPTPTLHELTNLFDVLPEMPMPLPRQRRPQPTREGTPKGATGANSASQPEHSSLSQLVSNIRSYFPWLFSTTAISSSDNIKPNPFAALKNGKKIVVIAAVDIGNISFFRLGQGGFSEWPIA